MERFWAKVDKAGPMPDFSDPLVTAPATPCWVWKANLRGGYGQIRRGSTTIGAHRVSYEIHFGAIPDGRVVDHLCRNKACVNPEHLEAIPQSENVLRGLTVRRDTCRKAGHPLEGNRLSGAGCRTCHNEGKRAYQREYMRRKRAQGGEGGEGG